MSFFCEKNNLGKAQQLETQLRIRAQNEQIELSVMWARDVPKLQLRSHYNSKRMENITSQSLDYPPFPLLSHFSVVVCLRWLNYHILSSITYIPREHWDIVSIIDVQSIVFANDRIYHGL